MIIDFKTNFKGYNKKILNIYSFFDYNCPKCGAKHTLIRHAIYERNIIYIKNETIYEEKAQILRVKCTSCNSTHAILPNDVIPYCIYSYSYVLQMLVEHFVNGDSVITIAQKYNISFQLIYYFINKMNIFFNKCVALLRIISALNSIFTPNYEKILSAIKIYSINNFVIRYYEEYKWMFLMNKFQNIVARPIYIGM